MSVNGAIEARGIERRFGRSEVLRGVDLAVPAGSVYGLLNRNGAGKTTLVQILLGMVRADRGLTRVLGLDAAREGPAVRARTGYVPERPTLYAHERVREIVGFVRPFYPSWNPAEEERLRDWLEVPYDTVCVLTVGEYGARSRCCCRLRRLDLERGDPRARGLGRRRVVGARGEGEKEERHERRERSHGPIIPRAASPTTRGGARSPGLAQPRPDPSGSRSPRASRSR